jgi:hypothetical protein
MARGRKYRWEGHVVYVALDGGKWRAVYDGPCGKERSYLAAEGLEPSDTQSEARAKLDAWAERNGLFFIDDRR